MISTLLRLFSPFVIREWIRLWAESLEVRTYRTDHISSIHSKPFISVEGWDFNVFYIIWTVFVYVFPNCLYFCSQWVCFYSLLFHAKKVTTISRWLRDNSRPKQQVSTENTYVRRSMQNVVGPIIKILNDFKRFLLRQIPSQWTEQLRYR